MKRTMKKLGAAELSRVIGGASGLPTGQRMHKPTSGGETTFALEQLEKGVLTSIAGALGAIF